MPNETMEAEIRSQPHVLRAALAPLRRDIGSLPLPEGMGTLWAGGCGDSLFAAQAASDVFGGLGVRYRAASALELGFMDGGPQSGDVVALISISGGTRRAVEAAARLRHRGVVVIAITCDPESALAREATTVLALPYRPVSRRTPHSVDYLITLMALVAFAGRAANRTVPELEVVPEALTRHLAPAFTAAAETAAVTIRESRFFYLGGLGDLGTAAYGAAKLHEAGGQCAIAAETENFVHGMNFMLEPGDVVIPIAGPGPAAFRARELIGPLAQLAWCHPVLSGKDERRSSDRVPLAHDAGGAVVFPFVAALYLQTLCHAVARQRCPDVERPRAGLTRGDLHASVQGALMKETRIVRP